MVQSVIELSSIKLVVPVFIECANVFSFGKFLAIYSNFNLHADNLFVLIVLWDFFIYSIFSVIEVKVIIPLFSSRMLKLLLRRTYMCYKLPDHMWCGRGGVEEAFFWGGGGGRGCCRF
jgi:hypothetical protein